MADRDDPQSQALDTVQDYITDTRTLLQDLIQPYRYDDPSLLVAFNSMLLEARRIRADLFVQKWGIRVPYYGTVDDTQVDIEPQFRLAFVYGTVGHALLRDQEDIEDARATSFLSSFNSILNGPSGSTIVAPPTGGVPLRKV